MLRLSSYILKQLIGPVALFTFLMTCVIWLTQALRFLDIIINRGQSALTFAYLTVLIVPSLLVLILPVSFFLGALYALSRLSTDSELVVMSSAGFSRAQLTVPVLTSAVLVMALTYACNLYLMPSGQRIMNDKIVDIQANIGTALFNEGTFVTPTKGLTVFIRSIDPDGTIHGALVHDNRKPKAPVTYLAQSGQLVQTPAGTRLVMLDTIVQESTRNGARLSVFQFHRFPFDLDQFSSAAPAAERKIKELFLGELLHPEPGLKPKARNAYFAEAHNRIAGPLFCIPFALIALAAVVRGRRARGANLLRMTLACVAASVLYIAGYGVQGMAVNNPVLVVLFYLLPLAGTIGAAFMLGGTHPKPLPPAPDPIAGPTGAAA